MPHAAEAPPGGGTMMAELLPLSGWLPLTSLPAPDAGRATELKLLPSSPWLDGHFPGRPLLPGVALLALAWETARQQLLLATGEELQLVDLRLVRFKQLVLPGAEVCMTVLPDPHGAEHDPALRALRFSASVAGEVVCQGTLLAGRLSARLDTP